MLNIVATIPNATLADIAARRSPEKSLSHVNPLPPEAASMLRDHYTLKQTATATVMSLQADSTKAIEVLLNEFPSIKVIGVWHMDTGLQAGLVLVPRKDLPDGTPVAPKISGKAFYMFRATTWSVMQPLDVKYDTDGKVVSSKSFTQLQQVHLWAGQHERIF